MIITGKVKEIKVMDDCVTYDVLDNEKSYHILSSDHQAVKDAIFLRVGQYVEVRGTESENMIMSEQSLIDIGREAK